MIELTVLGAGPAYTSRPGAVGASYLLRHGSDAIVLDLGQGAFTNLAGAIEPSTILAVAISHLHPDHFIDLIPLRHYLRWELPRRRVRVLGPDTLDVMLDALHGEPGFSAAALDVEGLVEGLRRIGPFELEVARVTHTESSYGFRVSVAAPAAATDETPGLVYSGDCGRAEDLDALARPGDTLLCEVSFGPGPVKSGAQHLDGPAVGALARRVGAGRVLLTHLQMGYDRAATVDSVRSRFDGGPVALVDPGFETMIRS